MTAALLMRHSNGLLTTMVAPPAILMSGLGRPAPVSMRLLLSVNILPCSNRKCPLPVTIGCPLKMSCPPFLTMIFDSVLTK